VALGVWVGVIVLMARSVFGLACQSFAPKDPSLFRVHYGTISVCATEFCD
jgi:hypothetical protein